MTSALGAALMTTPYVSVASFAAYPSYAELDNLVTGIISAGANNAQLNNMLIMSSQWVDDQVNVPVHGTRVTENVILRPQRNGSISWHPERNPVKSVIAMSYTYDGNFGVTGSPRSITDLSGVWIEGGTQVNIPFVSFAGTLANLQFGPPGGATSPLYTSWTYEAGYPHALLTSASIVGAQSIAVSDPTALVAGDRLRIWEPGVEEACTVASSYMVGATTVPLTAPLINAHTIGATVSAVPSTIQLATVFYACALLMRPDSTAEDQFPDTRTGVTTRSDDARRDGTGLIAEAYRQIRSYSRVR